MIKYHGTPTGGKRTDTVEFLRGRHVLIPYFRQDDLPVALELSESFILDNSAYSVWKRGKEMDFDGYVDFVESVWNHPGFDWALIPDTIDGTQDDNERMIAKWLRIGMKAKGVPVWHFHEGLDYLEWMANSFNTIALGSSGDWPTPGANKWWTRMDEIMGVLLTKGGKPKCKIHGLRMLDPDIFERCPFASADSTNAVRSATQSNRWGSYMPPTAGQRAAVIAARIESRNSPGTYLRSQNFSLELI